MHRFSFNRLEFQILLPAIVLTIFGLSAFFSIDAGIFRQQLISLFIAIGVYILFLNLDYKIFGYFGKYVYIGMLVSLAVLFVIGIEARGSVRWLDVFGVRIQFTEVIKPFFIIFMAHFLTSNQSRSLLRYLASLALLAPIFFLTLRQPDLGTALIFLFTTFFLLFMHGFPLSYFLGSAALAVIPAPFIYTLLHDYQKDRILTFLDPTRDPFGSSYNAVQSLISIGSGGLWGKGFGEATQSVLMFLPERHTDFIFATITESLGFLGAGLLIATYFFLMFKIYQINKKVTNEFANLVINGFYFVFLTQIFFNIGMNIGIVPIVGITLPFVSYGGNSLISSFLMLGIISSIKYEYSKRDKHLEII